MYPAPTSELSEDVAKELDDQFFTSDPFAYIRSKIVMLLEGRGERGTPTDLEFERLLGPSFSHYRTRDDRSLELQVAIDAFALRHQTAEALVRFLHAALRMGGSSSFWIRLTDTPNKNRDVCKEDHDILFEDEESARTLVESVLLAPELRTTADNSNGLALPPEDIQSALEVHTAWIDYAIRLLLQDTPDLTAAHNKFKHGMGLRVRDDVLLTFTTTGPGPDGGVPLSGLTGEQAQNLLDGLSLEFLARRNKGAGLESTQIQLSTAPMLVEAAAMAHTLALIFDTSARSHFEDREPQDGRALPNHPGLLIDGPKPGSLGPIRPFAIRFPLTEPVRSSELRDPLLFFTNGDIRSIIFGERISGRVVDDLAPPEHEVET